MELVLASRSPRREKLLVEAGYEVDVQPADVDERRLGHESPRAYVLRLARAKAVAVTFPRRVVIGADTVVLIDGLILGKPTDRSDAIRMLGLLAGRTHTVLTGVAVVCDGDVLDGVEETRVTFAPLEQQEIAWYVSTREPDDKAGAYGIQGIGSRFIECIEGSYTNVVGLPIAVAHRFIQQISSPPMGTR